MKTKSIAITKVNNGCTSSNLQDCIVNESPLQIIIAYGTQRKTEPLSVTMRTPDDDFNLVTGFFILRRHYKKSCRYYFLKTF